MEPKHCDFTVRGIVNVDGWILEVKMCTSKYIDRRLICNDIQTTVYLRMISLFFGLEICLTRTVAMLHWPQRYLYDTK